MDAKKLYKLTIRKFFRILKIGTEGVSSLHRAQRIYYFNSILFALPVVYFLFVLLDFASFTKPILEWNFDQLGFFIFVFICFVCFYLNHKRKSEISKILFIITWPFILHIIPIIIQSTPDDYYYAFPFGLLFHSILVQILFNRKESPWLFVLFLSANFLLTLNFLNFLLYFDMDGREKYSWLADDKYNLLVTILYWLLINFVTHFLLTIIDRELSNILSSKSIIEDQKHELESTLQKLQESNTQIIRSEKMTSLGILTAGVAHEINNPLNFINAGLIGIEDFIKSEKINKTEALSAFLNGIENGVVRISNIVANLNQFSKFEMSLDEDVDIHYIIDNCIEILNITTIDRITIKRKYIATDVKLLGNIAELHQLFLNTFNNSIHAIEGKGVIKVETKCEKNYMVIEISDTGCGIAEKDLQHIMDPFFTTKDPGQGVGLGLSIVYKIVEEHKGELEFESEINKGTIVRIKLPATIG